MIFYKITPKKPIYNRFFGRGLVLTALRRNSPVSFESSIIHEYLTF